jgi:hypothetical protein
MRRARGFRLPLTLTVASIATFGPGGVMPGWAQDPPVTGTAQSSGSPKVGVVAPEPRPTPPELGFERSIPQEPGALREDGTYPERTRAIYAPAFVKGGVKTVRTSRTSGLRMGLSGWTATRIPFDDQNAGGGPAFGLTIEWGVPLPPPAEASPPPR